MTMRAMKQQIKISEFPTIEGRRLYGETQAKVFQQELNLLNVF